MNSAEVYRKLFAAFASGVKDEFFKVAEEILEEEEIIFYLVTIETNKYSVIVFEEPKAHAFPYYTKFLAERAALDKNLILRNS